LFLGGEGGRGVSGISTTRRKCDLKASIVKGTPEMLDGLDSEDRHRFWDALTKSELLNQTISALRVRIENRSVIVFMEKQFDLPVQLLNVLLCPRDLAP
jgi:hypothetical protein